MKVIKKSLLVVFTILLCIFSFSAMTANAYTIDEAIITADNDKYVPLYTKSPDSSLKEYSTADEADNKDYQIFYTQTTVLALIAGYLILFKIKGIDHSEKMHRRRL